MRFRRPSHGTLVAYVALFVALGGTTYAATGGNFILGQSNGAGTPTRLTSPTTDAAGTLKVTNTASGGGRAIHATTNTGQGVYGYSAQNAGLVGESLNFDGVYGVSNSATHSAVSAHNEVWKGFGLWAAGGSAANNTAAVHGQSGAGNAVEGISGENIASGVYGQNNSTGFGVAGRAQNGTAVMGDSANGWAMQASGNATQSRARGGFVKAMVYVDPDGHPDDPIRQCFNSQRPPGQAQSGNCGITYASTGTGHYQINFGFQIGDRFVSATGAYQGVFVTAFPDGDTFRVGAYDPREDTFDTQKFSLVVY
jgi:hypothetical protein